MLEQVLFFTIVASFLETIVLLPIFISLFNRFGLGQPIRGDGPQGHLKKAGTPTMGGIIIVISAVIATLVMVGKFTVPNSELVLLLIATLGFGLIGFVDDFIKIVMKRNLGLTSKQKLALQIVVSLLFYVILFQMGFSTVISIEAWNFSFDLRFLYPVFVVLYLTGFSNAVNFTDGLDGLLSGTAVIAFGAFTIIAWSQQQYEIALYCVAMVGALLGFLVFNAYPAKIFMGDMGSLAIGGGIAAVAILLKQELLLLLIGGIFVIEILSVVLQVGSFKLTGKRIFKMSPIHHHFELSGWSEWRVVTTFWLVGLLFAITGIFIGVYW